LHIIFNVILILQQSTEYLTYILSLLARGQHSFVDFYVSHEWLAFEQFTSQQPLYRFVYN